MRPTSRRRRSSRSTASGPCSAGWYVPDLEAAQALALGDPAAFWGEAVADLGLAWQRPWSTVIDLGAGDEHARWWTGGAFDHAAAVLATWSEPARRDDDAVTWEGDDGAERRLTGGELVEAVEACADRFAAHGIGAGTRVGIFLPMLPETVITMLALGRLRAVFTPLFSGYAAPAVAGRLREFQATHLITADGFLRRGAVVPMAEVARDAAAAAPSVLRVLVVDRLGSRPGVGSPWDADPTPDQIASLPPITRSDGPVEPETPYMVIYTSGTTGAPKGTVHVHGGFPVKAAQDLAHTFDLRAGDALCWITDLGWMMGPWAISGALLLGARLVLFEGAPDHPDAGRVWQLVERHRITHLGISPTLIRALLTHGDEPVLATDRSSLRVLGSTGEPWNPEPWWWLFRVAGEGRVPIVNYTGGTEIGGGILGATALRPIRPTSFNGPCLGMAADVVDGSGETAGGRRRRAGHPRPVAGHDARVLGRDPGGRGALPRRLLATHPWHVDPRRLGGPRCRRLLVRARPIGRHPQGRRQAGRARGARGGGRRPPRGGPRGGDRRARRAQGRGAGRADRLPARSRDERGRSRRRRGRGRDGDRRGARKPVRPKAVVPCRTCRGLAAARSCAGSRESAWLGLDPGDLSGLENPAAVEAIAAAAGSRG